MLVTLDRFSAFLQTLGLTQGTYKPTPVTVGHTGINVTSTQSVELSFSSPGAPGTAFGNNFLAKPDFSAQIMDYAGPSCYVAPYDSLEPFTETFPPFDQTKANIYRYRRQQSVNLGSWFVQEQWMVPSLFICASGSRVSELDIASGWGSTMASRAVLERHWDTFIGRSDFEYLSSIGINTVRLPIGYWSLGPHYCQDTPFSSVADVYQNSWARVVRAINMAADAGIGVLVDLHGAVGSQNGQPHSGISDGAASLFSNPNNMAKTIDILVFLTQQLVCVTNVVGIQILNEPQNVPQLPDFYTEAISSMRKVSAAAATFPLYVHDGFDLNRFSAYVANRTDFVVQDHHSYFVYTPPDQAEPASQHTSDVKGAVAGELAQASTQQHQNLVVDEWSCALTPQSIANEPDPEQARNNFCTGQMEVYSNTTAGWGFWSYKKEDCSTDPGWCFKAAVNRSLPSTFFSYGQIADSKSFTIILSDVVLPDILAGDQGSLSSPTGGSSSPASLARNNLSYHRRLESIDLHSQPQPHSYGTDVMSAQQPVTKGYSDGFLSAKIFALYGLSKLGFIGQYINDSIVALGSGTDGITPGTEDIYRQWFLRGLQDGEATVVYVLTKK